MFLVDGLACRDQGQFVDVFYAAAAGKVVYRFVQTLKDRSYGFEVS